MHLHRLLHLVFSCSGSCPISKKKWPSKYSQKCPRFVYMSNQWLQTQKPKQILIQCLYKSSCFIKTLDVAIYALQKKWILLLSDTWKCECPEDTRCCRLSMLVWEFVCNCACLFTRVYERERVKDLGGERAREAYCAVLTVACLFFFQFVWCLETSVSSQLQCFGHWWMKCQTPGDKTQILALAYRNINTVLQLDKEMNC